MTEDDLDAVALLEQECFSAPWSRNSLMESLARPEYTFLVAQADEQVIGYAGMVRTLDEADVTDVAVFSQHRGQGAGKMLVEGLKDEARAQGVAVIYLEVRQSNAGAIALYRGCGFTENGLRKNFYENPTENALLFSAQIV